MSKVFTLVTAVVMLAAGFLIGRAVDIDIFTPKGILAVVVGPAADTLSHKKVKISAPKEEVLFWASKQKKRFLRIEFEKEVFDGMTHLANGRYALDDCKGRRCFSGDVKAGVAGGEYKYWQALFDPDGSHEDLKDGWIVIERP